MITLLSTTYFGPVQWYQKLYRAELVEIEQWESFQKQTYRNRCLIATTQGVQALTVPIVRGESPLIKDIRISDHGNWRHLHWNALQSAYGDSPFFDYFQDDIRPFFDIPIPQIPISVKPLIPNILLLMPTLPPSLIIRCISRNTDSCRTFPSSICCLTWEGKAFSSSETWNETYLKHFPAYFVGCFMNIAYLCSV